MKTENEIIAEFMGGWNRDPGTRKIGINLPDQGNEWWDIDELKYNTSWDWLMPVVEKICKIDYGDDIGPNGMVYPRTFGMLDPEGNFLFRFNRQQLYAEKTLIAATHKAVVEFIKWYNESKGVTN